MIVYDSKKWSHLAKQMVDTFKQSYNLQQLAIFMCVVTVYSVTVTIVAVKWLEESLAIDTAFFSLIGVILSLFMVFRLNSAYDRWWEGRKQWGKLVNDSRTFALNLNAHLPVDDKKRRRFFVRNLSNFAMALKYHLRDEHNTDQFIHINARYTKDLDNAKHVPNKICSYMYQEVEDMYKNGMISDFDKNRLFNQLQGLIDVLGACERIKKTPIPFSHSTFIKLFIIIYLLLLPFGLVDTFEYLAIPCCMIMGFALLGVEVISEEIENPFGMDANDLPVGSIGDGIRESVYEILQVKSSFVAPTASKTETEVLH